MKAEEVMRAENLFVHLSLQKVDFSIFQNVDVEFTITMFSFGQKHLLVNFVRCLLSINLPEKPGFVCYLDPKPNFANVFKNDLIYTTHMKQKRKDI